MGLCRAGGLGGGEPMRHWLGLLAIPATFAIGVRCGLPPYLVLRASQGGERGI